MLTYSSMISTDVLVWFTGCCTSNYNSCYHKKYFANSRIKHLIIKRKKTSDIAANKRVIAVLLFIAYRWAGVGCVCITTDWLCDCVSCPSVRVSSLWWPTLGSIGFLLNITIIIITLGSHVDFWCLNWSVYYLFSLLRYHL